VVGQLCHSSIYYNIPLTANSKFLPCLRYRPRYLIPIVVLLVLVCFFAVYLCVGALQWNAAFALLVTSTPWGMRSEYTHPWEWKKPSPSPDAAVRWRHGDVACRVPCVVLSCRGDNLGGCKNMMRDPRSQSALPPIRNAFRFFSWWRPGVQRSVPLFVTRSWLVKCETAKSLPQLESLVRTDVR